MKHKTSVKYSMYISEDHERVWLGWIIKVDSVLEWINSMYFVSLNAASLSDENKEI